MKKAFCTLLAILLFFSFAACSLREETPETAAPETGAGLSSLTAEGLDGGVYTEAIFRGHRLTMLNVWATYCGPCIEEMPDLAALAKAYGDEFRIVGIVKDAADRNFEILPAKKSEAESIVRQTGADYLHLLPSKSLSQLVLKDVQVVPTTFFVDENGTILGEAYYGSRSYAAWKAVVDSYLETLS